jgi:hypothetical protein
MAVPANATERLTDGGIFFGLLLPLVSINRLSILEPQWHLGAPLVL